MEIIIREITLLPNLSFNVQLFFILFHTFLYAHRMSLQNDVLANLSSYTVCKQSY